MQNLISISTGFLYKFMEDRNEMIKTISRFSPEGIEISFAHPNDLINFKLSESALNYLKSLNYVTIHAPWKEISYDTNQESKEVLRLIKKLYDKIQAKYVIFHINEIKNPDILKDIGVNFSIENMDWKQKPNNPDEIEEFLIKNKDSGFTFDFAHALTVSNDDISQYIHRLKGNLNQIHLSYKDRKLKDHWFLHKFDSPSLRESLTLLKSVSVPFVFECVASDSSEIPLIKKEIEYIKSI